MDTKELDHIIQNIADFSGLEHIGNGMNKDIKAYFQSFLTWLDLNNVLTIINNYKDINMNLQYVTSHDFLVWLLHYGDVYDNLLRHYLRNDPQLDYKKCARQLYKLRQTHPKFSFAVALASDIKTRGILSDNNLEQFIPVLNSIPNNRILSNGKFIKSSLGDDLYKALYNLSNFAIQRVAQDCL
ncbi:hypothetical protein COSHB9_01830 [Companilactobacillus alimentarius]|uniref:hypothetical protein n=1 Tax=Companilactobacillus alimentarius TaxID=1602 RepID=UPI0028BB2C89|nr:hypothetical protein [Companilactobacillus alimentarius]MDT6951417.1 hypothetical protein [Companilactobacillus alimentarius]